MSDKEYDDVSKKWSRYHFYKFILKSYPSEKQRKRLTVVFFPAEDALDYYEIFERVGILPENVIGLEKEKKVYKKILEKNHPFKTIYIDALDFFKNKRNSFDIISLDFKGMFTELRIGILKDIFLNNILGSRGILHTNFYGIREQDTVKKLYQTQGLLHDQISSALKEKKMRKTTTKLYDIESLNESRKYGISHQLMWYFTRNFTDTPIHSWYKKNKFDSNFNLILDFIKNAIVNPLTRDPYYLTKNQALCFNDLLLFRYRDPYFPNEWLSFSYKPNPRTQMFTDIVFLEKKTKILSNKYFPFTLDFKHIKVVGNEIYLYKCPLIVTKKGKQDDLLLKYTQMYAHEVEKAINNIGDYLIIPKRRKIKHTEKNKPNLSKKRLIFMLRNKFTPNEIASMCSKPKLNEIKEYAEKLKEKEDKNNLENSEQSK